MEPTGSAQRRLFAAILLLACFLRFYRLGEVPVGVFRDEVERGGTALELWQTCAHAEGIITFGNVVNVVRYPIFVDVAGVEVAAPYQWLSAPIVGIFGLSIFTTRFLAAAIGCIVAAAAFALTRLLFEGWRGRSGPLLAARTAGLAAMFFLAVSPGHILFGRVAHPGSLLPFFAAMGAVALARIDLAGARWRPGIAAIGGGGFALAALSYDPARLVVPFLFVAAVVVEWRRGRLCFARDWPAFLAFGAIYIPTFVYGASTGANRFRDISVFSNGIAQGVVEGMLNYLRHFDPRFLFFTGDANPRHGLDPGGVMNWVETPFFLVGVGWLLRRWRLPESGYLLVWILAAPMAASLTREGVPHLPRSVLFYPAVHIVSGVGFAVCGSALGGVRAKAMAAVAAATALGLTLWGLFVQLPREYGSFDYGVLPALDRIWSENPKGPNVLSAETPFSPLFVYFFEQPAAEEWQRLGTGALLTKLAFPGDVLPPGALLARPNPEFFGAPEPLDIPPPAGDPEAPPPYIVRRNWEL